MTNTVKHSHGKSAYFGADLSGDAVIIFFEDDGKGLQSGHGQGLTNMKKRAAMIHATLDVLPGAYGGVKVQIKFNAKRYAENGHTKH
jgi:signal transduction histidine kinase